MGLGSGRGWMRMMVMVVAGMVLVQGRKGSGWTPSLAHLQASGKVNKYGQLSANAFRDRKTFCDFAECTEKTLTLTKVVLPEGVTAIGDYAFRGCSSLQEVALPATLAAIGKSAFARCRSLKEIALPDTLAAIGRGAFQRCSSLQEIALPDTLAAIGDRAFQGCSSLQEVALPNTLAAQIGRAHV